MQMPLKVEMKMLYSILEDAVSVILQYGHHTNHGAGYSQYYVAILVANVYGTTFRCLFPYT